MRDVDFAGWLEFTVKLPVHRRRD